MFSKTVFRPFVPLVNIVANYTGPGTFTYHCHVHGNMKGTITVE